MKLPDKSMPSVPPRRRRELEKQKKLAFERFAGKTAPTDEEIAARRKMLLEQAERLKQR